MNPCSANGTGFPSFITTVEGFTSTSSVTACAREVSLNMRGSETIKQSRRSAGEIAVFAGAMRGLLDGIRVRPRSYIFERSYDRGRLRVFTKITAVTT